MRRTRLFQAAVLAVAGLLAAAGCGEGGSQTQSQNLAADQTLRFAISDDVASLDPAQVYSSADLQLAQNLFDGLVRYDDSLDIVPDVAANMPAVSADQLTYTFKLRPEATFSNGDRVTSRDVVYSLNRAAASQGAYASDLSVVAGFPSAKPSSRPSAARGSSSGWAKAHMVYLPNNATRADLLKACMTAMKAAVGQGAAAVMEVADECKAGYSSYCKPQMKAPTAQGMAAILEMDDECRIYQQALSSARGAPMLDD